MSILFHDSNSLLFTNVIGFDRNDQKYSPLMKVSVY